MNRPYVRKIRHNIYSQGESGFEIVIPYILIDRMQEAMGAVLIAFDPKTYLTQNFNTWLRSHPGREIVLRRPEGNGTAMLSIKPSGNNGNDIVYTPVNSRETIPSLAAIAETGSGIGNDYNQEKVFIAWNNIRDTDWKLIFKHDYNKAIRSVQNSAFGVAIITFFAVLVIGPCPASGMENAPKEPQSRTPDPERQIAGQILYHAFHRDGHPFFPDGLLASVQ